MFYQRVEIGDLTIKVLDKKWNDPLIHILTLLIVSIISHFPFVIKGIGEPDSARIAAVVIDRIQNGLSGPLVGYYFTDSVPLYVHYLALVIKSFHLSYDSLPALMNYTNAVFALLTVIPAYLLINRIFNNKVLAFWSVFAFIFNPSFFQGSIYGAPHLISFFFFLVSLYCFICWLDTKGKAAGYVLVIFAALSFSITMLLKSPLALGGGVYLALLYIRRVKEKNKIMISLLSLATAFIMFILLRGELVGAVNTGTTSAANFGEWIRNYFGSLDQYTFGFIKRQLKPPVFATGVLSCFLGLLSFAFFLYRRRVDILIFVLSWAAPTYIFWFFIYGNNARHFMLGVFPVIVMIVMFFNEKGSKLTLLLTTALVIGNYMLTVPSPSTYFPSGNLYKSHSLLQDRTDLYHAKAKEIASLNEEKSAVMGRYHNPYVLYQLLTSASHYEARLLTSVKSSVVKVLTDNKEFMLCYIASDDPRANIEKTIAIYNLSDYVIVSATYDLDWLKNEGIKTRNVGILSYEYP